MKTMTCNQLGGACEEKFQADTFEEMAELSKKHGTKMAEQKDEKHLKAMDEMMELMDKPEDMQKWFEDRRNDFNSIPDDK